MIPRYIFHPEAITRTPRLLARRLESKSIRYLGRIIPDTQKDFFLYYPDFGNINGPTESYEIARNFQASNKADQRKIIRNYGFPIPLTKSKNLNSSEDNHRQLRKNHLAPQYIVRPLRHSKGEGWRLTNDWNDFNPETEYIQGVYPKNHEYRIVCVRGVPIITLLKVHGELPIDQPWNHSNGSTFVTINDPSNCRLNRTDIYEKISSSSLIKSFDLCGIDILYRSRNEYVVCEINLCPSLQIEANLEKVVNHVLSLP